MGGNPNGLLRWGFLSQIKFFFRDVQNGIEKFLNARKRTEKNLATKPVLSHY